METYAARAPPGRALSRARISTPRHLAVFVPARLRESPSVNPARAARFPGRGSSHAPKRPKTLPNALSRSFFLPMNADAERDVGYFAALSHRRPHRHKMCAAVEKVEKEKNSRAAKKKFAKKARVFFSG